MKFFSRKIDIFLIFAQNIDCGYTLDPPRHNLCFEEQYKKPEDHWSCSLEAHLGSFSHHEMTSDLEYSHTLIEFISGLQLPSFRSQAEIVSKNPLFSLFCHVKAYVSKIDLAVK